MYLDKLDGRITQEFFERAIGALRKEQDGLLRKIQDIEKADARARLIRPSTCFV